MTQTNVTPTAETNQPESTQEPIDNMGNPVNTDGSPREVPTDNNDSGDAETVESLQKQLKDTKAALTKAQQGKADNTDDGDKVPQTKDTETDLQIQEKKAEDAGIDMDKYSEEYNTGGSLTEASYKELAAKGLDKATVDAYIAGREALAAQNANTLMGSIGGEDNFTAVMDWASQEGNLSDAEINSYNKLIQAEQYTEASLVLQGINAKYVAANGSSPSLIGGNTSSATGDTYKSQHDMVNDMSDTRYGKDPDFTKGVQEKAARSHKAGTI